MSTSRACVGGLGVPMFISSDAAPMRAMSAWLGLGLGLGLRLGAQG